MGVPKRMKAVQVVFFFALITIGIALKCQVCENGGLCTDDDDIGVATECPEDMTGCFYSKSKMMNKRKCQKVRRDFCYSWMQGAVSTTYYFSNTFCIRYFLLSFLGKTNV